MASYIARPDNTKAVITKGGGTNPSSDTTVRNNLGDNSDSTFVLRTTGTPVTWRFALTAPAIASDEFICRVGHSLRWKGGGNNKVVGVMTYRASDPVPAGYPALTTDGRTTITTTEIGYSMVSWSLADAAALRFAWYDTTTSALSSTTYELFATLYTLKRSTAVPTATTMTSSAFPAVPVNVTNVIDWEAGTPDWYGLRKITVEIRVEASSSTGAGTTPALSVGTVDYNALASGTDSITVAGSTAIANGSYKVYARATRHRENETSVATDQIGAWSSAVTLTMNAPLPVTPTITASVNQSIDRVTLNVTPVASSGYSTPLIDLERSDDGGTTWAAVRNGTDIAGTFGTPTALYDDEAPRVITVRYRARVSATYTGGVVNTGAWSTSATAVVTADEWQLKCPQDPSINIYNVRVITNPTEDITEDLGVFRPLDRRYPIVVAGKLGGWDGSFTIATITADEWDAVRAVVEAQKVLLLQSPFGWEKYVRIVGGARTIIMGTPTVPRRQVSFDYVEVGSP